MKTKSVLYCIHGWSGSRVYRNETQATGPKQVRACYDAWHKEIEMRVTRQDEKYAKCILGLMKAESGRNLLDIACGVGLFMKVANAIGLQTYGVDISSTALFKAKAMTRNSGLVVSSAEALPFRTGFFDRVTCLGSLEHFLHPAEALRELARVMKPTGISCILVPNAYFVGHFYLVWRYGTMPDEGGQQFSERFATREGWKKLIEDNGFEIVRIHKYNVILGSKKVSRITKALYNVFLAPFIPINLAYAFIFICKKT